MKVISEIVGVMAKRDKNTGKVFYKTLAILEDGSEAWGWSKHPHEYHVGDEVMYGFHDKYNEAKMMKRKLDNKHNI